MLHWVANVVSGAWRSVFGASDSSGLPPAAVPTAATSRNDDELRAQLGALLAAIQPPAPQPVQPPTNGAVQLLAQLLQPSGLTHNTSTPVSTSLNTSDAVVRWHERRHAWHTIYGINTPFPEPQPSLASSLPPTGSSTSRPNTGIHQHSGPAGVNPAAPTLQLRPLPSDATAALRRVYAEFSDEIEYNYPDGNCTRTVPIEEANEDTSNPPTWAASRWTWRSTGSAGKPRKGQAKSSCTGTYKCLACGFLRARKTTESKQYRPLCSECPERSRPAMTFEECDVTRYMFNRLQADGSVWAVCDFVGHHNHPPYPRRGRTVVEDGLIGRQVVAHPDATAIQHRTGTLTDSQALYEINPNLGKSRTANDAVRKAKLKHGIPLSSGIGGQFVQQAQELMAEVPGFVVDQKLFGDVVYIAMQSPFMRERLEAATKDWMYDLADLDRKSPGHGRHGVITDSDHSYFTAPGKLITSCVFDSTMLEYAPVLYTWVVSLDASHHVPHFSRLFEDIARCAGTGFNPVLFTQVMDFSSAQKSAFREAYIQFHIRRLPWWDTTSPEQQDKERKRFAEDAEMYIRGCLFHWRQSTIRIRDSPIISPDKRDDFEDLTMALRDVKDPNEFQRVADALDEQFPEARPWTKWWLTPSNARQIFPSQMRHDIVPPGSVPRTANPVEAQHSVLHRASGKNHDLLPGMKGLFQRQKEVAGRFNAIRNHHFKPDGGQDGERRRKRPREDYENDGRAPDTVARVTQAETEAVALDEDGPARKHSRRAKQTSKADDRKSNKRPSASKTAAHSTRGSKNARQHQSSTQPSILERLNLKSHRKDDSQQAVKRAAKPRVPSKENSQHPADVGSPPPSTELSLDSIVLARSMRGYIWSDESCWLDSGLQLLYWAYTMLSPAHQGLLRDSCPRSAPLYLLLQHFEDRHAWAQRTGVYALSDSDPGNAVLARGQSLLRGLLRSEWSTLRASAYLDSRGVEHDGPGIPMAWMWKMCRDELPVDFQQYLGVRYFQRRQCDDGHVFSLPYSFEPLPRLSLAQAAGLDLVSAQRSGSKQHSPITVADFLATYVPYTSSRGEGLNCVHLQELSDHSCPTCSAQSTVTHVETGWPLLLQFNTDGKSGTTDESAICHFPALLYIIDGFRTTVKYRLVGNIKFQGDTSTDASGHFFDHLHDWGRDWSEHGVLKYDGMMADGKLVALQTPDPLLFAPDRRRHLVVYALDPETEPLVRTAESVQSLEERHEIWKNYTKKPPIEFSSREPSHSLTDDFNAFDRIIKTPVRPPSTTDTSKAVAPRAKVELTAPVYSPPADPNKFWVLFCVGCNTEDDYTSGSPEPDDIVLCNSCQRWSHIKCEALQFGLPEDFDNEDSRWTCASCRKAVPLWNDNLLEEYVAIPYQVGRQDTRYPARVLTVSPSGVSEPLMVELEWHHHIERPAGLRGRHKLPTGRFTRPAMHVAQAQKNAAAHGAIKRVPHGRVIWPMCFKSDDPKRVYTNPVLLKALRDSIPDLVTRVCNLDHPALAVWEVWYKSMPRAQRLYHIFLTDYPIPILPGDEELIVDVSVECEKQVAAASGNEVMADLSSQITVCLYLVALRVLMRRRPEDDDEIAMLWRQKRIVRHWTSDELALISYQGETSRTKFGIVDTDNERLIVYSSDRQLPDDGQDLVEVLPDGHGHHHQWASDRDLETRHTSAPSPPLKGRGEASQKTTHPPKHVRQLRGSTKQESEVHLQPDDTPVEKIGEASGEQRRKKRKLGT